MLNPSLKKNLTHEQKSVLDRKLYSLVTPRALLAWQRVRLANALATDGAEWADLVARHNSGTYNNQYIVVDLKRFTPRAPLPDGLLTVVEQLPGFVKAEDATPLLVQGYFASFNVPFFREVCWSVCVCQGKGRGQRTRGGFFVEITQWVAFSHLCLLLFPTYSQTTKVYDRAGYGAFHKAQSARGRAYAEAVEGAHYQVCLCACVCGGGRASHTH